ncbi:hypothetical protein [Halodesulfurarchaeum sp.]|uniref:hypothetical protein n=1 Tax=Halodesulfurarchaeum sp. TaxID=1980530 RepID=UPI002FC27B32
MKKSTGVDTDISDGKCHEHLACSDCQTGECPLNQLQKETEKTELRYEDGEVIIKEVTGELPNGETKHFSMVAEPIADESGEVAEMVQSLIGMTELK